MTKRSFEEELNHTKEILNKLMDPEITLEESIRLYEEGIGSVKRAQQMIEDAKIKVEKISKGEES